MGRHPATCAETKTAQKGGLRYNIDDTNVDSMTIWRRLPNDYRLSEGEVHVWRAALASPAKYLDALNAMLSPDERARADRFRAEADRTRHIVGRGLLRMLLGRFLECPPAALVVEYSEHGKPGLAAGDSRASLQFNVSHSGEWILVAIASGRRVGVDVERMRTNIAVDEIAKRFFSQNECRALATLPASARLDAFYSCWTRKEAYLKATGQGLSLPLDQFDVSCLPGEAARLVETRQDPSDVDRWSLQNLDLGRSHKAAVAAEGMHWQLRCWEAPSELPIQDVENSRLNKFSI
jgi:4'-phosphopantetheinyl transferase